MGMQTGENEQGLRKILDMTRLMGIGVLGLHFYYYCYGGFEAWGWKSDCRIGCWSMSGGLDCSKVFCCPKSLRWGFWRFLCWESEGGKTKKPI